MPRIYLDVCCLNRPFDDQTQARIRLEAEAVLIILGQCEAGRWEWIASEVVDAEVGRISNPGGRRRVQLLISHANRSIAIGEQERERAQQLESWGVAAYDALHLACAEAGGVEYFITCDDNIIKKARTDKTMIRMAVCGPLEFVLKEVFKDA